MSQAPLPAETIIARLESAANGAEPSEFNPRVDFKLLLEARDLIERQQEALREACSHLSTARAQRAATDDQIIANRIDEAFRAVEGALHV